MAKLTIEKPELSVNSGAIRRLVQQPDKIKAGFFSKLAGSRLGRWAERYAEYQLETRYRNEVRL
jgi:hypothetical protein